MSIRLKRVYVPPDPGDGFRVLVDRLWPRGVSKRAAHMDLWLKEVAPSTPLRKWFGHDPDKWADFRDRYVSELRSNPEAVEQLNAHVRRGVVTLVYAARDPEINHAAVLKQYLENSKNGQT